MNSTAITSRNVSRRNFAGLATAAVGGLLAGGSAALAQEENKPEIFVDPALLLSDPNVCKGLNMCGGHGKGEHDCAGKGSCASVDAHSCGGSNDCKGKGGCGGYPGQNTCNEKGHCAVPLKEKAWELARKQFEHLMKDLGKTVGAAPE